MRAQEWEQPRRLHHVRVPASHWHEHEHNCWRSREIEVDWWLTLPVSGCKNRKSHRAGCFADGRLRIGGLLGHFPRQTHKESIELLLKTPGPARPEGN